jgi:APA family basic amino acid/polyamine antiporter
MTTGSPRLSKELGLFDVYAISTGAMFSSGFFLLPGLAAAKTGPSAALAYLVAGLFILPAMLSKAELATAMPRAGGAYYFLDRALGPLVGTIGGLGTWLALVLKSAFALVGIGAYLGIYFDVPIEPLAVGCALLFTLINIVGAKETGGLQRILVTALIGIMAFFILQGLVAVFADFASGEVGDRFSPFLAFGFQGFMSTVGFVFVSYAGLTKVASVAEEIRDPDRNIPLGMGLSLATAIVVYTVGVFIIVTLLPAEELRHDLRPVATAAQAFFTWLPGGTGVMLIVVAAIAAFASTGNAGILSASRYPLAMARDGLVSPRFGKIGRHGTPTAAILATSLLMIACILFLDVEGIAKLASAFQLLLFSLVCLAVVIMRESKIEGYDPGFESPLYPWMQIAGFVLPFWLIAEMGSQAILFTLALITLTIIWYFAYGRDRTSRSGAIFHTFARLGQLQHAGLDVELRGIVKEKGLRAEDPFDEVVARAPVLDLDEDLTFEAVIEQASQALASHVGVDASILRRGFEAEHEAGFIPVAKGAALPHLRVPDLDRPTMLIVRSRPGIPVAVGLPPGETTERPSDRVHAVFFLLSPEDQPGQHLRLLGHLATHVDDVAFVAHWLAAEYAHGLRATLLREEHSLSLYLDPDGRSAPLVGMALKDVDLPDDTLVALVRRSGQGIIPQGSTVFEAGDRLTIIGSPRAIRTLAARYAPDAGW